MANQVEGLLEVDAESCTDSTQLLGQATATRRFFKIHTVVGLLGCAAAAALLGFTFRPTFASHAAVKGSVGLVHEEAKSWGGEPKKDHAPNAPAPGPEKVSSAVELMRAKAAAELSKVKKDAGLDGKGSEKLGTMVDTRLSTLKKTFDTKKDVAKKILETGKVKSESLFQEAKNELHKFEHILSGHQGGKKEDKPVHNYFKAKKEKKREDGDDTETYHRESLLPEVKLSDNNVCGADEELFEGMCYMSCTLLTATHKNGRYSVRTSPMSCCKPKEEEKAFSLHNCVRSLSLPCNGFDIAGKKEGFEGPGDETSCPHAPGLCLENEELYLGMCYKKCSDLTANAKPYRTAIATCCKKDHDLLCLLPFNAHTSAHYAVGGGEQGSLYYQPHPPISTIAEAKKPPAVTYDPLTAASDVSELLRRPDGR